MTYKILVLIFIAFVFFIGLSHLFTAFAPIHSMTKIEAQVVNKKMFVEQGTRSASYKLLITIDKPLATIPINYSTEAEAKQDSAYNLLDIGKIYTFYLNPPFPAQSGIYKIKYEGALVFEKAKGFNAFVGTLLAFASVIGVIVLLPLLKVRHPA